MACLIGVAALLPRIGTGREHLTVSLHEIGERDGWPSYQPLDVIRHKVRIVPA